jgi:hypothetical protein
VLDQIGGGNGRLHSATANYVPAWGDGNDDGYSRIGRCAEAVVMMDTHSGTGTIDFHNAQKVNLHVKRLGASAARCCNNLINTARAAQLLQGNMYGGWKRDNIGMNTAPNV